MTAIRLAELPGHRLADAVTSAPLAVLPTGSIEYHGPHGPFGTDLHLAEVLAQQVADNLDALLLPPVPFSHCPPATRRLYWHHRHRRGHVGRLRRGYPRRRLPDGRSRRARAQRSRRQHSSRPDGRRPALGALSRSLSCCWSTGGRRWPRPRWRRLGLFTQDGGHGHGGPLEMSAADAARPGTVDWGAARRPGRDLLARRAHRTRPSTRAGRCPTGRAITGGRRKDRWRRVSSCWKSPWSASPC